MTEFKNDTSKQVYYRTYSRTKPDGSQETWAETVRRVVDGNLKLVEPRYIEEGEREALIDLIEGFKVLPAGRHLKSSGVNDFALNNCWAAGWDSSRPEEHFTFTLLRLAEGGGVGSNYSSRFLEDFPAVQVPVNVHIVCDPEHQDYEDMVEAGLISTEYSHTWAGAYAVEDSREGWAEALGDLIRTAHDPKTRHTQRVYDVSRVRCKGSPLKTFGGTASGPAPFAEMMWEVGEILSSGYLDAAETYDYHYLTGIDAMRIDHAIAKAIVAGGVRRSARMSIMRWDDPLIFDFINIKKEGGHWTTNISVEVDQEFFDFLQDAKDMGDEAYEYSVYADEVLKAIAEGMLHNGEPGVWNSALTAEGEVDGTYVTNPCQPSWATVLTPNGMSTVGEVKEGDLIWSEDGWVEILDKWSTGVKEVNRYHTTAGYVDATSNHRIVESGTKVEVGDAEGIDRLRGPKVGSNLVINSQAVADGLVLGDGYFHKASNLKPFLCVGSKDQDYYESEVAHLFTGQENGAYGRGIQTTLTRDEMATRVYDRCIPERYLYGSKEDLASFLRGVYSANGSICGGRVTLKTTSFGLMRDVQLALSSLGIASYYTTNKPSKIKWENGTYESRESYDLNIGRVQDVEEFAARIGFIQDYKTNKLIDAVKGRSVSKAKELCSGIRQVESLGNYEVWDITVSGDSHTYWSGGHNVSNCGEATLTPWEPCNLGSVNLAAFVDTMGNVDDIGLAEAHRVITRYLIRATFADVADPKSAEAIARYRRIGVGHLGFADWLYKQGIRYTEATTYSNVFLALRRWAALVDEAAAEYANELRIPVPIKKRVIAPTGTISKLAGVSGEATHAPFAAYFIRRIRFSNVDPNEVAQVEEYRRKGYRVEPCQYAANTSVVEIPTKDSLLDELEYPEYFQHAGDLTIRDMLNVQRMYQEYWADQAVSYTANVDPGQYSVDELSRLLAEYLPELKGATCFPEMSMPQSPYERVSFEEYKARAEEVGIEVTDTGFDEVCASGACPV